MATLGECEEWRGAVARPPKVAGKLLLVAEQLARLWAIQTAQGGGRQSSHRLSAANAQEHGEWVLGVFAALVVERVEVYLNFALSRPPRHSMTLWPTHIRPDRPSSAPRHRLFNDEAGANAQAQATLVIL